MKGYFRAGIACLQLAKHEEAVNEYQKALAIEPQNAAAKASFCVAPPDGLSLIPRRLCQSVANKLTFECVTCG